MSEQDRANINSNAAQFAAALLADDFDTSITPGWELIVQGLRDLNRIADALEVIAINSGRIANRAG